MKLKIIDLKYISGSNPSINGKIHFLSKVLLVLILMPLLLLGSPFHTKKQITEISSSVVKIYTTSVKSNYFRPWQKGSSRSSSGTGVIIDGHMILTAAHVVSNGTFIQVKKSNDSKKYTAQVKWIAHEVDLALLEVNDPQFFTDTKPQVLGTLPYRQDGVVVYGYPLGGDELSTTKGIVSRIEHIVYSHSFMDHLAIQIDAPINPGNSGGPAFDKEGKMVGIAIQAMSSADGIGYLVPAEVIKHFFDDIKDGHYDGYPDDGMYIQDLQNKNIRSFYNLGNRDGVLVTHVIRDSSADGYAKRGDVILELDGVNIAGDNTIKLKGNGRVSGNYLIRSHQVGDMLNMKILRDKKEMQLSIPLKKGVTAVPLEQEKEPRYYIFGGMVFMPLSINYLKVWGKGWQEKAPMNLLYNFSNQDKLDKSVKELVILNDILANEENANYAPTVKIVSKVNGQKINSLNDLVKIIEESKDQYIDITFDSGSKFILDKEKALKLEFETMEKYGIGKKKRL